MSCNCSNTCVADPKAQELEKIVEKYKNVKGALIPVLHEAQDLYGYLPMHVQKAIADGLGVPLSEVYGVITFYSQFSLYPKGKYQIQLCLGTACYVKGAGLIYERFKQELGLKGDGVTEDGLFSLQSCRCIGACGLAPVIMINGEVYGRLVPDDVPKIIKKYRDMG
ncbi:NAD(P)H-dependent oxidoreductase subunit E [Thermoclostridium stercorarium]|uniref:NADH-quinone oxidoreductase subunit NuoE family protein n=1 Tax=Thermoclostridium stercorarium TaxID=1510 RepID=UPI002249327F|nr:NAD(P)H-dependent oxidoreductase subunit E [Thermoclostridium stercorarium]UZQ86483.1 NAD(P)H-dependent oxidoreductase subunit E [Thermoclostridium stercorarium]